MKPPRRVRVLITAGPTFEPIDAVRFIGNRSSGRMGLALAEAAFDSGHAVTLLLGPTNLDVNLSSQVAVRRFQTCAQLQSLLRTEWPDHDVLLMAAAVADYRPSKPTGGKLRRDDVGFTLDLEPTPDLLQEAARGRRPGQLVIGFALEPTGQLERAAREKLVRKGLDAIIANPLETMEATAVSAALITADGRLDAPPGITKAAFARWLLDRLDGQFPVP